MFLLKKGKYIKGRLEYFGALSNQLQRYMDQNDEKKRQDTAERMEAEKKTHHAYLEGLPRSYTKSYSRLDYGRDVQNVINYYTKWTREDIFESKPSLSRLRKYEKREGLRPFDEILIEQKRINDLERLSLQG